LFHTFTRIRKNFTTRFARDTEAQRGRKEEKEKRRQGEHSAEWQVRQKQQAALKPE
jgi:hypothetical protein